MKVYNVEKNFLGGKMLECEKFDELKARKATMIPLGKEPDYRLILSTASRKG